MTLSADGKSGTPILRTADGWRYLQPASQSPPLRVYRRKLATGRVEHWRDIAPADLAGVATVLDVLLSDDANTIVYSHSRIFSEFYLAEGRR